MMEFLLFLSALLTSCFVTSVIGITINLVTNWNFYVRAVQIWRAVKEGDYRMVVRTYTALQSHDESLHQMQKPMVYMVISEKWEATKSFNPYHKHDYGNIKLSDYDPDTPDSVDVVIATRYTLLGSPFVSIPLTFDWMLSKFDKRFERMIEEKIDPIEKLLMV